jgi:hypothetical protein
VRPQRRNLGGQGVLRLEARAKPLGTPAQHGGRRANLVPHPPELQRRVVLELYRRRRHPYDLGRDENLPLPQQGEQVDQARNLGPCGGQAAAGLCMPLCVRRRRRRIRRRRAGWGVLDVHAQIRPLLLAQFLLKCQIQRRDERRSVQHLEYAPLLLGEGVERVRGG